MKAIQLNRWVWLSMTSLALACTIKNTSVSSSDGNAGTGGAPSTDIDAGTGGAPSTDIDAGDAGNDTSAPSPSIEGSYLDNYGDHIEITADTFILGTAGDPTSSVFHFVQVDNANSFAIAQNDAANSYNANQWSRFDWAKDSDQVLWYCQTVYGAASAEQALQTPAADAHNLDTGCSGFAWSKLTPTS
jgi:hypothetical protein